jgi:hypothetical protein
VIKEAEIAESQKINGYLNPTVISNKFHINLQVPSGYAYVLQKSNFMWLKRDYWGNTSLLIYQVPLSAIKKTKMLLVIS